MSRTGRRYNQTQEVIKHRDRRRNHPGDNPQSKGDAHPGSHSNEILLVDSIGAPEDTDVDIFACDVAVDNAADDDLRWNG
jgi:hypothetical protein